MMMMMTGTVTYVCLALYDDLKSATRFKLQGCNHEPHAHWRTEGGVHPPPPPEIPKALQNRAKLNLIVKIVKNC